MTPKQRYLFDLTGYLHLKNVLSDVELQNAQDAVERCAQTPADELPPGISYGGGGFSNGFSYDKSLEALTLHPKTWGIVKELTSTKVWTIFTNYSYKKQKSRYPFRTNQF